jgi:hypothetical protein
MEARVIYIVIGVLLLVVSFIVPKDLWKHEESASQPPGQTALETAEWVEQKKPGSMLAKTLRGMASWQASGGASSAPAKAVRYVGIAFLLLGVAKFI